MDEIEGVGWEPAPLPVERVRGARPASPSKEGPEPPPERRPKKSPNQDDEEAEQKRSGDTYQREDEPEGEAPTTRRPPESPASEHLIDVTI